MPSSLSFASLRIWSGISGEGERKAGWVFARMMLTHQFVQKNFEPHQTMLFQAGSLNPLWDVKM